MRLETAVNSEQACKRLQERSTSYAICKFLTIQWNRAKEVEENFHKWNVDSGISLRHTLPDCQGWLGSISWKEVIWCREKALPPSALQRWLYNSRR
jgi:hypothetical protein